ncbi:hypothetical protein QCA50_001532 [Cerrena zonata]|uniref:F-box domain-containing protein n=1 Tax=Cerrena zonata TaxID=2478898 RepID=A0AAW0GW26_9APHY
MHHCLTISEILDHVFEYCVAQEVDYENTLAAVARTCKTFYEPAVSALYYQLQDLSPLLKLLPKDFWFEEQEPGSLGGILVTLHLTKLPEADADWANVNKHLHRVKKIKIDDQRSCKIRHRISHLAIQAIVLRCAQMGWPDQPNAVFLPQLETLYWDWGNHDLSLFGSVFCIASSRLKIFSTELVVEPAHHAVETIVAAAFLSFPRFFPALQILNVTFLGDDLRLMSTQEAVSNIIPSYPELRRVELPPTVEDTTLFHVAQLPFLTHLSCYLPQDGGFFMKSTRGQRFFPALKKVYLHGADMNHWPDVIQDIQTTVASSSSLRRLFKGLEKQSKLAELRVLASPNAESYNSDDDEHVIHPETLKPLLSLHNLTSLFIEHDFSVDLDDECVKSMALSWPDLQHLTIIHREPASRGTRATLQSLGWLVKYCRRLRTIHLGFNPTLPPPEIYREIFNPKATDDNSLIHLHFSYYSPVESANITPIVAYILDLLPKMKAIHFDYGSVMDVTKEFCEAWDNLVEEMSMRSASLRRPGGTSLAVRSSSTLPEED